MVRLVKNRRFGVSTRLFHTQRLAREHLIEIAAHGFETVELFATRSHLDFHNPAVVADFQQWLAEAGLDLASVTVAPADDAEQALFIARRISVPVLTVGATTPRETAKALETLGEMAAPLGVKLAVDSTSMSPLGSLVHFVESGVDADVGICLDFAGAHRTGDLADALELVAEHLVAARLPVDSTIDWAAAMTTAQKIGYEGSLMFDADVRGSAKETLARAKTARSKMERWLTSI